MDRQSKIMILKRNRSFEQYDQHSFDLEVLLDHGEERKHPSRARLIELMKQRLEFLKIKVVKICRAESWRVERETEKEL